MCCAQSQNNILHCQLQKHACTENMINSGLQDFTEQIDYLTTFCVLLIALHSDLVLALAFT